jgi:hypothetical protein
MKLIPEWRRAWRMLSVQIGALAVLWVALPAETQAAILRMAGISETQLTAVLGVLVIVARLIAQPKVRE